MLFNSLEFFGFLIVVYIAYRILPFRWQNWLLLVAGYVFYGWWDVRFLFLIACSTTVDFSIGLLLAKGHMPARQRWTASLFLIGAALLFLCPDWSMLNVHDVDIAAVLKPQTMGLKVLLGTIIFVLVANLLISRIAEMPKERVAQNTYFLFGFRESFLLGLLQIFQFFCRERRRLISGDEHRPEQPSARDCAAGWH